MRVTTHNTWRGFPIRRPSDHSSFISSPRLIADYRVLHRLLMPRHPPCALKNLTTQNHNPNRLQLMHSINSREPRPQKGQVHSSKKLLEHTTHTPKRVQDHVSRCSRPLCSSQTTTPSTTPTPHKHEGVPAAGTTRNTKDSLHCCKKALLPQDPTVRQTQPGNQHPGPLSQQPPHTQKCEKRAAVLTPGHHHQQAMPKNLIC